MNAPVLFQAMPPLSPDEYAALEQSIKEHGVLVPVLVDEDGVVIDGHHRQKITEALGVGCRTEVRGGLTDTQKRTLALSLNVDRRHLTRDQRRALVEASLRADPQLSNREHARRTGVHHETVDAVRKPLEERGEIRHVTERSDSLGRQQPAAKITETTKTETYVDTSTGEVLDLATAKSTEPRRSALPEQARKAGWELRKAVERVERIAADDRFNTNQEQMATHLRSHLTHAVEVCQDLLDRIHPPEETQ